MEAEMAGQEHKPRDAQSLRGCKRQEGPTPRASGESTSLSHLDLRDPALPGSQKPCPAWILVVLPHLDLSGPALPGSHILVSGTGKG